MRKVTQTICKALMSGERKSIGNTSTDGETMFLHGNPIARLKDKNLILSLAGWNTVTTRERINGLLMSLGLHCFVCQRKGEPYVFRSAHGQEIPLVGHLEVAFQSGAYIVSFRYNSIEDDVEFQHMF
jgi:hypothetical protein